MIEIIVEAALWEAARQHLDERAEQVRFFLADWSQPTASSGFAAGSRS